MYGCILIVAAKVTKAGSRYESWYQQELGRVYWFE